jgi:hypothetical protein
MSRPFARAVSVLALVGGFLACDALRYFGPEAAEREHMEAREEVLDAAGLEAHIDVYPIRRRDGVDAEGARELAALIQQGGLGRTRALDAGPWFGLQPSMNEQSPLWELARKFREHARASAPHDGYVLYADYMLDEEEGRVFAVHFVVCDRDGEWVRVEFLNSHHGDFQRIAPRDRVDCARLVVAGMRD